MLAFTKQNYCNSVYTAPAENGKTKGSKVLKRTPLEKAILEESVGYLVLLPYKQPKIPTVTLFAEVKIVLTVCLWKRNSSNFV